MVDKPRGRSSFWMVNQYKKKFPGLKVGHAGTLDPLAEGLLIILVGKATKLQKEFEFLDKQYRVELVFGLASSSFDLDGEINLTGKLEKLGKINKGLIEKEVKDNFFGQFVQTVPIYSAVKRKGQRLYKLARKGKGEKLVLPKREVELSQFSLLSLTPLKKEMLAESVDEALEIYPKLVMDISVSKGFYVRSLVSDLGKKLSVGAVTTKLVRTRIGPYRLKKAIDIFKGNTLASVGR